MKLLVICLPLPSKNTRIYTSKRYTIYFINPKITRTYIYFTCLIQKSISSRDSTTIGISEIFKCKIGSPNRYRRHVKFVSTCNIILAITDTHPALHPLGLPVGGHLLHVVVVIEQTIHRRSYCLHRTRCRWCSSCFHRVSSSP